MTARFDGRARWDALTPALQREVGSLALEYICAGRGCVGYSRGEFRAYRPFLAAWDLLVADLECAVLEACPDLEVAPFPVPSRLGKVCGTCHCSDADACFDAEGPCSWASDTLCSRCAAKAGVAPPPPTVAEDVQ